MPGMIDVHVHIDWHFQPNGLFGQRPGEPRETPEQADQAIQANLDAMLDRRLHDRAVARLRPATRSGATRSPPARCAGPRILTSLGQISAARPTDTPDQLARARPHAQGERRRRHQAVRVRQHPRRRQDERHVRSRSTPSAARRRRRACARSCTRTIRSRSSRRSRPAAARSSTALFADDGRDQGDEGRQRLLRSEHRPRPAELHREQGQVHGLGNYNEEGFAFMEKAVPTLGPIFNEALEAGLRMPLGTDAVAGAHGQNAREVIARVKAAARSRWTRIIGATSLAADRSGWARPIGTSRPATRRTSSPCRAIRCGTSRSCAGCVFVMKGGRVVE